MMNQHKFKHFGHILMTTKLSLGFLLFLHSFQLFMYFEPGIFGDLESWL